MDLSLQNMSRQYVSVYSREQNKLPIRKNHLKNMDITRVTIQMYSVSLHKKDRLQKRNKLVILSQKRTERYVSDLKI
jgi:hypothetical protein